MFSRIACYIHRADTGLAPRQWETSLQSNAVSHWLGANRESTMYITFTILHALLRIESATPAIANPAQTSSRNPSPPETYIFHNIDVTAGLLPRGPVLWNCFAWEFALMYIGHLLVMGWTNKRKRDFIMILLLFSVATRLYATKSDSKKIVH